MATGVFGLRKVYIKQNENIDNRNFASWPESATYGYFGGGQSAPPATDLSIITRLDFSNELTTDPGKNFPLARGYAASISSAFYGYFGGGFAPPGSQSIITRLDFSSETLSDPGKNLQVQKIALASVQNSSYGYFGGGFSTATVIYVSTISRLDFSNETVIDPGKNLPTVRGYLAAVSTNSYGYFGGGYSPPYINTITRFDFSNETASNPGKNLSTITSQLAAVSTNSYGYFGGGQTTFVTAINTISRLDFSNETVSDPGKNLPSARYSLAATSNNIYGYFGGGISPPTINTITRLDFSNETVSAPGKNLPTARSHVSTVSGGQSINRGSKTYSYIAGSDLSTISRLDLSIETVSDPGKNLPAIRSSMGAVSSNYYGYFGGGLNNSIPARISTITRLDFSNETVSDPGKNLPTNLQFSGGLSSNSYGYYGGGYSTPPTPPSIRICTISRLDFSTENVNVLPGQLPGTAKSNIATVSNNFYGYFCGGFRSVQNTDSIVTRLDFSSETVSDPGKNLPTSISTLGAVSSNSYGYFGGGYTAPSPNVVTCTVRRLDFSNETISLPGKNLPFDKRSMAGSSSAFNGYFSAGQGGFLSPVPNGFYADNLKLDFSSETVTSIPATFPSTRASISAVSNSN